jgi:DNA repair ATPase RecN
MTPETLKSTCIMFRTELEHQGASMGIMSVFDSMCSYLGGESRDLNRALAALEEAQQQAELAYAAYEGLQGFCVSRGEYDSLLNKHSVLARAHRESQQEIERLKNLFDEDTKELIEAQQTIARKRLYIEKLELSRESAQKAADNISKEKGLELFEARQTIARQREALDDIAHRPAPTTGKYFRSVARAALGEIQP